MTEQQAGHRLLTALTAAGIPVASVSVRDPADRATWRVDYAAAATVPQKTAGEALRLSFDPDSVAAGDLEIDALALSQAAFKDKLADFALLASVTDPGWAAATLPQKVAKVRALAVTWRTLRSFAEKNL